MRLLTKWAPHKYGDHVKHEVSGPDGGAIKIDNSAAVTELVHMLRSIKRGDAIEPEPHPVKVISRQAALPASDSADDLI